MLSPAAQFSLIFSDFLSSATAIAAGAPSTTALQRRHLTSAVAITPKSLLVDCEADPDSTDSFLTLTLTLKLEATLGTETSQITRTQAETWLQALRALLDNSDEAVAAWNTWIALQTDDYKSGWSLQAIYPKTTEHDLAEDKNVLTLSAPYTLTAFWG